MRVGEALVHGAELVFVWGGDGTVRRCADVLARTPAAMAIVPAGTANLLAANLGVPADIRAAVRAKSPFVRVALGSRLGTRFDRPVRYQVDGGARKQVTELRIKVRPSSLSVCVPADTGRSTR